MSINARNKEQYGTVLREAVEGFRTRDRVHVLTPAGLQEVLGEPVLYRAYKAALNEGCSAETAEQLDQLYDNFQLAVFHEATLSSIQPTSALTMPMLRKAWPKIGMKEALPTEPVKTPKFTVSYLSPYMIDPTTGLKVLLPEGLKSEYDDGGSQHIIDSTVAHAISGYLTSASVLPGGVSGTAVNPAALDPIFSIVAVDVVVADASGANPVTLTNVAVYDGAAETRQGNIRSTVTVSHPSGHQSSDTMFGYVNFTAGTLTLTSMGAGQTNPSASLAKITNVYIAGKLESTSNSYATQVGYDITTTEIHIGTGEHFDAALPIEWLMDNLALYNIDGTLKVVDIMTEVLAQRVDIQGTEFVNSVYQKGAALNGTSFTRTFDVWPTGNYNGSPTDWLAELRRITDNLAQSMRNFFKFGGGQFVIVGNPIDIALFPGIQWIFTAQDQGGAQKDGVQVNYQIGAYSGAQSYAMFSSQNFAPGTLYMFFVPGPEDQKVLVYYPYTFNIERSSSGFVSPNTPNVPSVMMTKRHVMKDFLQMVGQIQIVHNDGSLPV